MGYRTPRFITKNFTQDLFYPKFVDGTRHTFLNTTGKDPVSDIEEALIGVRYDKDEISNALANFDLFTYFGNIEKEEFINLIYGPDKL